MDMQQILLTNIKELVQVRGDGEEVVSGSAMSNLPTIKNAWLLLKGDFIQDFGEMVTCPSGDFKIVDVKGKMILPTWVDCHTHIVFAASREEEFVMKIKGQTYEEIASAGGGILNSARKLRKHSEDELYQCAADRLIKLIKLGTGGIEIKSGYGLSKGSELKMLRVIRRLKENFDIPIKANLLAAHAIPEEYNGDRQGYIDLIIQEIIPEVAAQNLAEFIDVFCEQGFFSVEETDQILKAGLQYGLRPKIHANQLAISGGVQVGVKNNAISVDHLEQIANAEIESLKTSNTIPVVLPSCSFYLRIPYAPVRALINANLPVAIASDYNPGSTPSGNMNFLVSLACIKMKMLPEEAINAATINAAHAMGVQDILGSISRGKLANFFITSAVPSVHYLAYSFGENCIQEVWIKGRKFTA
jgi:imidazolonepropionase